MSAGVRRVDQATVTDVEADRPAHGELLGCGARKPYAEPPVDVDDEARAVEALSRRGPAPAIRDPDEVPCRSCRAGTELSGSFRLGRRGRCEHSEQYEPEADFRPQRKGSVRRRGSTGPVRCWGLARTLSDRADAVHPPDEGKRRACGTYREAESASAACSRAAENPLVADSSGQPVCVEALEDELGRTPAHAEKVAEAREGNRSRRLAFRDQKATRLLVGDCADGEPIADPDEPPLLFQEVGELGILDLDRVEAEL